MSEKTPTDPGGPDDAAERPGPPVLTGKNEAERRLIALFERIAWRQAVEETAADKAPPS